MYFVVQKESCLRKKGLLHLAPHITEHVHTYHHKELRNLSVFFYCFLCYAVHSQRP